MTNLVLIHGFGMTKQIFDDLIEQLSPKFNCINISLPEDEPTDSEIYELDELLEFIEKQVSEPAIWLGWSFGGMLALAFAKYRPHLVQKLILVSSTAKFIASDNWKYAVSLPEFMGFYLGLVEDYPQTMRNFFTLQTLGNTDRLELIQQLEKTIKTTPDIQALTNQLAILSTLDLRQDLAKINQNTVWIMGEYDRLCFVEAAQQSSKLMPNSSVVILQKCNHIPFITHKKLFVKTVLTWIKSN